MMPKNFAEYEGRYVENVINYLNLDIFYFKIQIINKIYLKF